MNNKTTERRYIIKDVLFISPLGITEKLKSLKKELGLGVGGGGGTTNIRIDRDNILKSSMDQLKNISGTQFRNRKFHVDFNNELGSDAGGLRRSWFSMLMREIIKNCLVQENEVGNYYHLNELRCENEENLDLCEFMGKLFAKLVVKEEPCSLHIGLGLGLFKAILGEEIKLEDLPLLDSSLGKRFKKLSSLSPIEIEYCKLNFVYYDPKTNNDVELLPNGEIMKVTDSNLDLFMKLYIHKKFMKEGQKKDTPFIEKFKEGFFSVIPKNLIQGNSFRARDLHHLIEGDPNTRQARPETILALTRFEKESEVSVADSERIKKYWLHLFDAKCKLYDLPEGEEDHLEFGEEEILRYEKLEKVEFLENLLFFFTGYFHLPSFGMKSKLVVRSVTTSGNYQFRLPTAHTCVFQISVPVYQNYLEFLRAITIIIRCGFSGYGFQ